MRVWSAFAILCLLFALGCRAPLPVAGDHPRVPADARMTDLNLHSAILGHDVPVRIIAPAQIDPGKPLPVVYILHGAGEDYRNWTNETPIAEFAAHNVLLVMPDGLHTYYVNDARGHRYEDFFFQELIPAVHEHFPSATKDRAHTAIVGNSRGGFAATLYGLKHPELFSYVVGLSSAMDLSDRHFRWRAPRESLGYRRIFGPRGSAVRRENDPYRLARNLPPAKAPYFDLSCAEHDVLLPSNKAFASLLAQRGFAHRFVIVPGDHDWSVWNGMLPGMEERLLAHLALASSASPRASGH
jgi:S-formylglutathione hydrolase FrmB